MQPVSSILCRKCNALHDERIRNGIKPSTKPALIHNAQNRFHDLAALQIPAEAFVTGDSNLVSQPNVRGRRDMSALPHGINGGRALKFDQPTISLFLDCMP